uniref:Uncharacterized protein n=1 Tax=Arundo donax TaxID=35708 RepID=A0A0A8XZZ4_ARUDO
MLLTQIKPHVVKVNQVTLLL